MLIGIPVYDQVDMLDVAGPHELFSWANYDVEFVAEHRGALTFRNGFGFNVAKSFAEAGAYDGGGGDGRVEPGFGVSRTDRSWAFAHLVLLSLLFECVSEPLGAPGPRRRCALARTQEQKLA